MIKEWTELNRILSKMSNYALAKEYGLQWVFISLLIFYVVSSCFAIYLAYANRMLLAGVLVGLTLSVMQLVLNHAFFKKYDDILHGVPYSKKLRYFKYLRFKSAFNASATLRTDKIDGLIKWMEVENHKAENTNFFTTKIFTVPATGLLAFIFGYFGKAALQPFEVVFLVVMVIGLLSIASSVFEIFKIDAYRQTEIKRSLKWLLLEQECEVADS